MPKYEKVVFYRNEVIKIPTVVKFRRADGKLVSFNTYKTVIVPKKVVFYKKVG